MQSLNLYYGHVDDYSLRLIVLAKGAARGLTAQSRGLEYLGENNQRH